MDSSCVELLHALPGRWRYRLRSAQPLNWGQLERELSLLFSAPQWRWRLNRAAASLLLWCEDPCLQNQGWQSLLAAMERCGAVAPPPEVVRVKVTRIRERPLLKLSGNLISLITAGGMVALALLLTLLGILGLLLPLAPGFPLLVLAFALVEGAIRLRRPYTCAA
jgi:hypothetical protein